MGTTNVYNIDYHFEKNRGLPGGGTAQTKCSPDYYASVSAAASDYNSIRTVLNNNSLLIGTSDWILVLDNVQADPSGNQTILT